MQQLTRLLEIMSDLRNPETGCPWDLKQDYKSLVPYTLEEAYEVAEAIELGDMQDVKKELGDLLFQVVFYAQLAKEEGLFDFNDIAGAIADKMVSRHPHVFADHQYKDEADFLKAWEQKKELEKQQAQADSTENTAVSLMAGISKTLPAMTRAVKIQKKAAQIGFDWAAAQDCLPKIQEELTELTIELENEPSASEKVEQELGDVLFSCVNLARKLAIDPEKALRHSNYKFSQRFKQMEVYYQNDRQQMEYASMEQLEQTWQLVKNKA